MNPENLSDAAAVLEWAEAHTDPMLAGSDYPGVWIKPDGEFVDAEEFGQRPRRKQEQVTLATSDSLGHYVNKHLVKGATELYADVDTIRVVAVLDDSTANNPGWGVHRATLQLRHTPEWKHWLGKDNNLMAQDDFALHIEDGLNEITSPPAADMLELAQTFQANVGVTFSQAIRLADGQRQLTYSEEQTSAAGKHGQIVVPGEFELLLPCFEGGKTYEVTARLRHRLRDGRLTIGYKLVRPHDVLELAFDNELDKLAKATGLAPFLGTAPTRYR